MWYDDLETLQLSVSAIYMLDVVR